MGLYVSFEEVKTRLTGKVKFDESGEDPNTMSAQLAQMLLNQAEADVEMDLSPRYMAPFQTDSGGAFNLLPDRPTKQLIKTLVLCKVVSYIMDTDFGRGTAVDGENYTKLVDKQYKSIVGRIIKMIGDEDDRQWMYPPLPSLRLNYNNTSDDGFQGQIYVTSEGEGAYAGDSVSDPSKTFWNAEPNDILPSGDSSKFEP